MKNISVGKKLLLGFGAVILMIAIILALTIVTSFSRNDDLSLVSMKNDMQVQANQMLDNFNLARVEIRSLFSSIDAEEEYNLALEYLGLSNENLDKVAELSEMMDGYMSEEIVKLRNMFAAVEAGVIAVGTNDEASNEAIASMRENGTTMADSAAELYIQLNDTILNVGSTDPEQAIAYIESILTPIKEMEDVVGALRIDSRDLMLNQDISIIAQMKAAMDDITMRGNAIRGRLTVEDSIAAVDRLLNAMSGYRVSVDDTEAALINTEEQVELTRVVFGELNTLIGSFVEAITKEVDQLNGNVAATSTMTTLIMVVVGVIAALFAVAVAVILARMITRPLNKMKVIATQAGSTGDLNFSDEMKSDIRKEAQAKDELGQSLKAFISFVERMTYMGSCLEKVARKDLTVKVDLLSDHDTMGNFVNDMVSNLNEVFEEINSASSQVATAANEIASGAQSLAQGSTEQAVTIERISSSISEINEQITINDETATHAVELSQNMSRVAETGNEKMSSMADAMNDINEASNAISRVIKIIDDIAFQTNILALNAAVEAARAGPQGKGFAVVAEEVRSLAGKSVKAAEETASLISINIEKTGLGLKYTQETVENLTQITQDVADTSASLQAISDQSRQTKEGTAQVAQAVDQVSQVIQQNSANSEQSAAASQELSSQARVLEQLISQFKLRDGKSGKGEYLPEVDAAYWQEEAEAEDTAKGKYNREGRYGKY